MLDLKQGLGRNKICVLSPVYRSNGSSDLDFWGEKRSKIYEEDEEDYGVYSQSPRLWTSSSPLLPCNHLYSFPLSPKSRLQAIVDGRRELMELIQDMPESSYELSLKDIVDEQHQGLQEDEKDIVIDERSLKLKPQVQMKQKKKKKKKNCKTVEISRCQSMDSGAFLLKLFFPSSLSLKRKSTAGNRLKVVSPRTSSEGSDKEWWIMRFLAMGDGKKSAKSSLIGSSRSSSSSSSSSSSRSSSRSSSTRQDDSDCTPGCWPFHKKCRSRKQKRSRQL